MKKLFTRFCNCFLAFALLIGTVDVAMMSRIDFYQPPVPEALLNKCFFNRIISIVKMQQQVSIKRLVPVVALKGGLNVQYFT